MIRRYYTNKAVLLAKSKYKLNQDELDAAEFIFWFSFIVEQSIEKVIKIVYLLHSKNSEEKFKILTDKLFEKLTFEQKITVFEDFSFGSKEFSKIVGFYRKIKDLRNHVSHLRFKKILDYQYVAQQDKLIKEFELLMKGK